MSIRPPELWQVRLFVFVGFVLLAWGATGRPLSWFLLVVAMAFCVIWFAAMAWIVSVFVVEGLEWLQDRLQKPPNQ